MDRFSMPSFRPRLRGQLPLTVLPGWRPLNLPSLNLPSLGLVCLLAVGLAGCGGEQAPGQPAAQNNPPQPVSTRQEKPPEPPPVDWNARLDEIDEQLASNDFDAARASINDVKQSPDKLSEAQQHRLAELDQAFTEQLRLRNHQRREELLAEAARQYALGDLEAATKAVDDVLASVPTAEQRQQAGTLAQSIEAIRRTRRELMTQMRLLESDDRGNVRTARSRLLADAEVALPMLLESLHSQNPTLVANCLEVLRVFNEPERVVPGIVSVLENPNQAGVWPAAVREIERLAYPGAGSRLLALSLQLEPTAKGRANCCGAISGVSAAALARLGGIPCQREAVLTALSVCNDPPQETLVALLPSVFGDGRSLTAALLATNHAVQKHNQTDLAALRNIPGDATLETAEQLAALPARLHEIIDRAPADAPSAERDAALMLAVVTRQIEAPVLKVTEVSRSSYSSEEAPAAAAVDGEWNVIDLKQMWQHPSDKRPLIVLDLGEVRTVCGIRIWNYNLPGNTHRGWRDVDLFVSETPSLLTPVAQGLVPPAPGRADVGDYGTTLPVPFVRGRYIKIEPRSTWREDSYGGVTEIQVLGF